MTRRSTLAEEKASASVEGAVSVCEAGRCGAAEQQRQIPAAIIAELCCLLEAAATEKEAAAEKETSGQERSRRRHRRYRRRRHCRFARPTDTHTSEKSVRNRAGSVVSPAPTPHSHARITILNRAPVQEPKIH